MPRRAKGPRLWFRPARRNKQGLVTHADSYFILDAGRQISVGSGSLEEAESALAEYLGEKRRQGTTVRSISETPINDVAHLYIKDVVQGHANPDASLDRLSRIVAFFGHRALSEINGALCRAYARQSSTDSMARRDLEDLRSAINHHRREGLHDRIVSVVLPPARPARERWLSREEVAMLLWTLWRRKGCKHVAKFILVALYTGRRSSVVMSASFQRETGRPWIDLAGGMLWPPERARITNKRNPPIPLPVRLLSHLNLWHRNGQRYAVEWGGHTVERVGKTLKAVAIEIGLGDNVTAHVLRHTAASWQMQAGTDMFEAGKFLGMTTRTLETVYAHHRPEHLTSARDAYARTRRKSPPMNANDTREPTANANTRKNAEKAD